MRGFLFLQPGLDPLFGQIPQLFRLSVSQVFSRKFLGMAADIKSTCTPSGLFIQQKSDSRCSSLPGSTNKWPEKKDLSIDQTTGAF